MASQSWRNLAGRGSHSPRRRGRSAVRASAPPLEEEVRRRRSEQARARGALAPSRMTSPAWTGFGFAPAAHDAEAGSSQAAMNAGPRLLAPSSVLRAPPLVPVPAPARWGHISHEESSDEEAGSDLEEDDEVHEAKFNSLGTLVSDVWDRAKRRRDEREAEQRELRRVCRHSAREHQALLGVFVLDYSDSDFE